MIATVVRSVAGVVVQLLVSFGNGGRVEEYDADGNVVWRIEQPGYGSGHSAPTPSIVRASDPAMLGNEDGQRALHEPLPLVEEEAAPRWSGKLGPTHRRESAVSTSRRKWSSESGR